MNKRRNLTIWLAVCTLIMTLTGPVGADTHHVLPGQSIQAVINDANNGDEIEVEQGTYYEAINFNGKVVRLYSIGGPDVTTINGTGHYHVVQCLSGEGADTVLEGFTITGGNANGSSFPDNYGGGMFNNNSSPTVTNCIFSGNTATSGGGMYNKSGNPTVSGCVFRGNTTVNGLDYGIWRSNPHGNHGGHAGHGGGMYNDSSSPIIRNCEFTENRTGNGGKGQNGRNGGFLSNGGWGGNGGNGGNGAGIYNNSGQPRIIGCRFSANETGAGGPAGAGGGPGSGMGYDYSAGTGGNGGYGGTGAGIYNNSSTAVVANCEFMNNITGNGGNGGDGLGSGGDGGNGAEGGHGAGIGSVGGNLDLTNCVFSGNWTYYGGNGGNTSCSLFSDSGNGGNGGHAAGILNCGNSGKLINCTFYLNQTAAGGKGGENCLYQDGHNGSRGSGGGVFNIDTSNLTVTNCILWEDRPGEIGNFNSTPNVTYCDIQGGYNGTGNIKADPHFVDINNPDLNLWNLRLRPDSPCIDAGDNDAPSLPDADYGGHLRIIDAGCDGTAGVDMGAYEFNYAYMGDLDYNCGVDFGDFAMIGRAWFTVEGDADYDPTRNISVPPDKYIDWRDLAVIAENWLTGPE